EVMPSSSAAKLPTKKGLNGFTSKLSSKDPSGNQETNGNGTKTMKGRRKMRSQKRAWRAMPKEEPIEDGYAKCRYVSRRIGIACD
uniref:Uncharacterized protein n=1 Tax=Parascaris univalens TaxID=6257 RepID=A0A915CKU8_PARUN